MKKSLAVLSILIGLILVLSNFTIRMDATLPFHSAEELAAIHQRMQTPIGPGEYFQPSSSCQGCHGYDTLGFANIDENGMDVNLFDHWQSTMMALSAKDPLWRAKVSQEILVNPAHANELQTKCTSCHAPMGHYNAVFHGATTYTISDLINDTLGLDGVSCAGCHTIGPSAGSTFSGLTAYDTTRTIYGPFQNPFAGPMQLYEGYTPTYSPHMDNAAVCSSCHTLITQTADLSGNLTGDEFVEQATYHEYLNSSFPANNIKCQTCHMPQLADPIVIANGYLSLQARFPFNQHTFAGANYFMLNLIKNNKTALGAAASDAQFDSSMAATLRMLQQQSVTFDLLTDSITSDTAYYTVDILNKAGHKFPSGYPSRRAVLQLTMTDAAGDTVFQSGIFDENFRVKGETPQYEGHHNVINQNNVSQIYELVMGDVNGDFTSVLERAAVILKDNRIPPDGFTTTAPMYDTVQISADALNDADFNKVNSVEGSGRDKVHFAIPVNGVTGAVQIKAKLYYQSVPPKWLDEMFTLSSPAIDTFKTMFQNADQQPVLVASDSITDVLSSISEPTNQSSINVYPSFASNGQITIECSTNDQLISVDIYTLSGKKLKSVRVPANSFRFKTALPGYSGALLVNVKSRNGQRTVKVIQY